MDEWKKHSMVMALDDPDFEEWEAHKQLPYHAANGHTLVRQGRMTRDGLRVIYSDSNTYCTSDCVACTEGYPLEDW